MNELNQIKAEQLVVGMKIFDPLDPSRVITITGLIAISKTVFGLGCDKGYVSIGTDHVFQLAESFKLPVVASNWIVEQLEEDAKYSDWLQEMDTLFQKEQDS